MTPGLRNGSRSVTSIIVNWDSAFAEPSIEMCNNVSSQIECSVTYRLCSLDVCCRACE